MKFPHTRVRWQRFALVAGATFLIANPLSAAAQSPTATPGVVDLAGLKTYMVDHAAKMEAGTAEVLTFAQSYYDEAKAEKFDYQKLWDAQGTALQKDLEHARDVWSNDAHGNYELNEGMVAGIPSLAYFDELIDAGPSAADDPTGALDFTIELPDGTKLVKPGNLFHYVTERQLWGTEDEWVGLKVDFNGDGKFELGEALPNANALLGSVQALDHATAKLGTAIAGWQPNLDDAFTALVVMIPTMDGYFNEWKLSPFVLGDKSTQKGLVARSRLIDVLGILSGLDLTYNTVSPLITAQSAAIESQIRTELDGLIGFVQNLSDKEAAGTRYTPDQADQFGSELQARASSLAGQISQAAGLVGAAIAS